jgi:hypothetical protein
VIRYIKIILNCQKNKNQAHSFVYGKNSGINTGYSLTAGVFFFRSAGRPFYTGND